MTFFSTTPNYNIYLEAGFSEREIRKLRDFLTAHPDIHWISLNPQTGIYEMFLDNSIMASFRSCPSMFILKWVEGYSLKGGASWILEFGTLFHKMIEIYYQEFRRPNFSFTDWAIKRAAHEWHLKNMDQFSYVKEYTTVGGLAGFCTLLAAYSARFNADNERLRVIGTEIPFGKNKEVPLGYVYGTPGNGLETAYLSLFLSGRIDVLVDDRASICPLDHKTKSSLRNDPSKAYEIDEGPTGYVYAVHTILPSLVKELNLPEELLQRSCNKILMNYISKAPTQDPMERFRRLQILKTESQLEAYKRRMLHTGEDIFRALVRYASKGESTRNTSICYHMYGSECEFAPIHRQSSRENELFVLNSAYTKGPIWDTENPAGDVPPAEATEITNG